MEIIAAILPLIFGILSLIHYKKITSMQFLFNLLWFCVVLISSINILQTIPVRKEIYIMSILFTIVFNIGGISANFILIRKRNALARQINYTFIKMCIVFVGIFYAILLLRALIYLNNGGSLGGIRYEYFYGNAIIKNIWENLFYSYLVNGVYYFLTLFLIYNIIHKGKLTITISVIGLTFIKMIFSGGRLDLLQLILLLVVELIMYWKSIDNTVKKIVLIIMLLGIAGVVFISLKRNVTGLIRQAVAYFTSSMAFSSAILNTYALEFLGFGRVVFAPILDFIINTLRFFGLTDVVSAAILISNITKDALVIGLDGGTFNALVPAFFHLYMGGGYLSIIVFGFLFGLICVMTERRLQINSGCSIELLWMFLLIGVVFSSMGWRFTHVNTITSLACIFFVEKKTKKCGVEY